MNFPRLITVIALLLTCTISRAQEPQISGENVVPEVRAALIQIGRASGEPRLVVKAKERTAVDQARIMFKALETYKRDGKDGYSILHNLLGDAARPALDAHRKYLPQGKDLTIEYMAYHVEEVVKKLRKLPPSDPQSRALRYVLPLPYHLVEIDAGNLKNATKFEQALASTSSVLNQYTLKPDEGKGRACDNCYLVAIRK